MPSWKKRWKVNYGCTPLHANNQDISLSDHCLNIAKIVKLAITNLLQINNPASITKKASKTRHTNLAISYSLLTNMPFVIHHIEWKCIDGEEIFVIHANNLGQVISQAILELGLSKDNRWKSQTWIEPRAWTAAMLATLNHFLKHGIFRIFLVDRLRNRQVKGLIVISILRAATMFAFMAPVIGCTHGSVCPNKERLGIQHLQLPSFQSNRSS